AGGPGAPPRSARCPPAGPAGRPGGRAGAGGPGHSARRAAGSSTARRARAVRSRRSARSGCTRGTPRRGKTRGSTSSSWTLLRGQPQRRHTRRGGKMRLRGGSVQGRAVTRPAAPPAPPPPRRSTADAPAPGKRPAPPSRRPRVAHPLAGPAVVVAADGAGLAEGGVQRALVHLCQAVGGDDDAPRRTEPVQGAELEDIVPVSSRVASPGSA